MKKNDIKILFGINGMSEDDVKQFVREMENEGISVSAFDCRYLKIGVGQYLDENPDTDVAILSQYLETNSPYQGNEFEMLIENHENVNFIPILVEGTSGSEIVGELFQLGIFNGLFANDAMVSMIIKMITEGRSRKEARVYYDVRETTDEMDAASIQKSVSFIQDCSEEDAEKNALHVLHMVKPSEFRKIINMLDEERFKLLSNTDNDELKVYFYKTDELKADDKKKTGLREKLNDEHLDSEVISSKIKHGVYRIGSFIAEKLGHKDKEEQEENISENLSGVLKNVMIGFTGTSKKCGVTHQAILAAYYLMGNGYRVALFDVTGTKCNTFESIKKWQEVENIDNNCFEYRGVDYYKVGTTDKINNFLNSADTYNFIIVDYGLANSDVLSDIGRCTDKFLIAGSSPWERGNLIAFHNEHSKNKIKFNYMIRGMPKESRDDQEWVSNITDEPMYVDVVEDPFSGQGYESMRYALRAYVNSGECKEIKHVPAVKRKKSDAKTVKTKVVGTESIFITSLDHGTGKTHFSVAVANYLAQFGTVGLITKNRAFAYENADERIDLYREVNYKEGFENSQYIIFDCGDIDELSDDEYEELKRANKKVMLCWTGEYFFTKLADYLLEYRDKDLDNWSFVFNHVTDSQIKETKAVMSSYNTCYLPTFEVDNLTRDVKKIIKNVV